MLLVDMDTPGVTARPFRMANGLNEVAEVFFSDVRVPADRLIGTVDKGWTVAMYLLQFERGMYAWMRQAALGGFLRGLCARLPSTAPGDSATRTAVGEAHLAVAALRARSQRTVERLAGGETVGPEASADKVLLAYAEPHVLDTAHTLRASQFTLDGGAAAEHLRSTWFHTRAASIYGGAAEIHRGIIADRVLGLPRERS